ncbi:hypothetical protein [Streptomyces wuyuanensis]|uniref:Uncharacterized protein n=1 Tax=Streptomyces wuyuanensis TaxID=1196353 RepID=A0A1H0B6Y8_9ACTN|nr:hypothetical protein [Streptomyces wuyuanensis]SDN41458.1 hypothetical protein SAMN05444921_12689 [Streptomyces wuyuanensis]
MGTARSSWKVRAVVAVLVLLVAGLLHAYRNTNVLTADRLCGGLVSAANADAVLPGSGRVSAEGDGVADDLPDTECEVEKSSVVVGGGKGTLSVRVAEERGDFPVLDGRWPDPARASFFTGPVTGGVYEHDGWVLLPEKCWTDQPVIVEAHSSEPVSDTTAFGALLTDAAGAIAAERACGTLPKEPRTPRPPRSQAARPASEGRLCGLDGFSVHGQVPADSEVLEAGQVAPADLWSCTVFLGSDSNRLASANGFMTYMLARDPLLLAAVEKDPGTHEGTGPGGKEADVVEPQRIMLPCAQGAAYLALEPGLQYTETRQRHPGTPSLDAFFESSVRSAIRTFDCGAATR